MKRVSLLILPEAREDVVSIAAYSLETWGPRQLERYVDGLNRCFSGLSRFPRRGPLRNDLGDGYRSVRYGAHVIFYRIVGRDVVIVRVLHERQDYLRHLVQD